MWRLKGQQKKKKDASEQLACCPQSLLQYSSPFSCCPLSTHGYKTTLKWTQQKKLHCVVALTCCRTKGS